MFEVKEKKYIEGIFDESYKPIFPNIYVPCFYLLKTGLPLYKLYRFILHETLLNY